MKYIFLDFDRTLFDTDRFYNKLERQEVIGGLCKDNLNLADFLYPDAIPFLKSCQNAGWKCCLVTFGKELSRNQSFWVVTYHFTLRKCSTWKLGQK